MVRTVRVDGRPYCYLSVDCLTADENQALIEAIEEVLATVGDILDEDISTAFGGLDLDEDYDPDEEDATWEAEQEAKRPQRLADERAALLRNLAKVDAELADLNATLIA